jgi:hypothetical protein
MILVFVFILITIVALFALWWFFIRKSEEEIQFSKNLDLIKPPLSLEVKTNLKNLLKKSKDMPSMQSIALAMKIKTPKPVETDKPSVVTLPEPFNSVLNYIAQQIYKK